MRVWTPQDNEMASALENWLKSRLGIEVARVEFSRASNGFSAETIFADIADNQGSAHNLVFRIEQPGG